MSRVHAAWSSCLLGLRLSGERREERNALVAAGAALAAAGNVPRDQSAELAAALDAARVSEARHTALESRLEESLARDRADYRAAGSELARWLAITRGVVERWWVREELRSGRASREQRLVELARLALETPAASAVLPAAERVEYERARAAVEGTERERGALHAAHGGDPRPRWLRGVAGELALFSRSLRAELARKFLLRLPALAAMLAAWWLTRTYTSSTVEAAWHDLTGAGRAGLSRRTLAKLEFWLPLLAAALAAYASATVARRVRRRYDA
jgi:hypothetical protein